MKLYWFENNWLDDRKNGGGFDGDFNRYTKFGGSPLKDNMQFVI
ncbi:hypothetical protein [Mycoplasmopsis cynos]|nr:hypothetical protein [Mycoplasmopsis cynos]